MHLPGTVDVQDVEETNERMTHLPRHIRKNRRSQPEGSKEALTRATPPVKVNHIPAMRGTGITKVSSDNRTNSTPILWGKHSPETHLPEEWTRRSRS